MSRICCVLVMAVALLVTGVVSNADAQERSQAKLVLQITVDGLRGDLLRRYDDRFGEGNRNRPLACA